MTRAENFIDMSVNGWIAIEKIASPKDVDGGDLTGSNFSVGYIVEKGSDRAFLKVIDIDRAIEQGRNNGNIAELLARISQDHKFEERLLNLCADNRLSKIIKIIDSGQINHSDGTPSPYIIFELADGDVRKLVSRSKLIDDKMKLITLHGAAVGLKQLHGQKIAHQDLKPSNILIFMESKNIKIADLGRSSCQGIPAAHDGYKVAGAVSYAPPEQLYGETPTEWVNRREACDIYHLGTLASFLFSGMTLNTFYKENLHENILPPAWSGKGLANYTDALMHLQVGLSEFISAASSSFPGWAKDDLIWIIKTACNPDYKKRGAPSYRSRSGAPVGIDVYISKFNNLILRSKLQVKS